MDETTRRNFLYTNFKRSDCSLKEAPAKVFDWSLLSTAPLLLPTNSFCFSVPIKIFSRPGTASTNNFHSLVCSSWDNLSWTSSSVTTVVLEEEPLVPVLLLMVEKDARLPFIFRPLLELMLLVKLCIGEVVPEFRFCLSEGNYKIL